MKIISFYKESREKGNQEIDFIRKAGNILS
jgi:hypothetical protein